MRVYIGTYTGTGSRGIYLADYDPAAGILTLTGHSAEIANPTFVTLHPSGRSLYAASEVEDHDGKKQGAVAAYAVAPADGGLTPLGAQLSCGTAPCHVSVEATGRYALVANYSSGSAAILPIRPDGGLDPASDFVQHGAKSTFSGDTIPISENTYGVPGKAPHAHFIIPSPDNRFALCCDLGLDQVLIYKLDLAHGKLLPHGHGQLAPGAGPRHLTFDPTGTRVYVINELGSTMTAFHWDAAAGTLTEFQTASTLPAGWSGTNYPADVHLTADGRHLYGSNRGHHSLAIYALDVEGRMAQVDVPLCGGDWPRNFAVVPDQRFVLVANERSDNIVTFTRDAATGKLTPTGAVCNVPKPVCLSFA